MPGDNAAVRASYLKGLLERTELLGPEGLEIRRRLGDPHLTSIECAGPLVWLPIATDLDLVASLDAVLGPERTREFVVEHLRRIYIDSPIQLVLQTAVTMFGLSPGSFARLVPSAWGLLYRNCGRWTVERSPDVGRGIDLRLAMIPQECVGSDPWLAMIAATLHTLLVLGEVEGQVALAGGGDGHSFVIYRILWAV